MIKTAVEKKSIHVVEEWRNRWAPYFKKRGFVLFSRWGILALLIGLAFIFLYPLLYMLSTAFMSPEDIVSPLVFNIPQKLYVQNFIFAYYGLDFLRGAGISLYIATVGALGHLLSCSIVGYGFARYKSRLKNILFVFVIFTFIVPAQTLIVPLYFQFARYGWANTYRPALIPAFFSQGLKGALFVIVFRQFFASLPWELDDAARIDGAGGFKIFWKIMLPLSKSALIIVFLFSFVWHWNDHYFIGVFLRTIEKIPLSIRLKGFWAGVHLLESDTISYQLLSQMSYGRVVTIWSANSEGIGMAACFLVIAIPLIIYLVMQRFFTESIGRTGLVD